MRRHANIEIESAVEIYESNGDMELPKLFEIFDTRICGDYKGVFLYAMVRAMRPRIVVETGVAGGLSSYAILQALEDNGSGVLYSIDLPNREQYSEMTAHSLPLPAGGEPGFLVPDRLRDKWTLILGDSKVELPKLRTSVESIDFFIHDSLHEYGHMMFEYNEAWPKLNKGGVLFSDDISSNNAFQDFCKAHEIEGTLLSRKEPGYKIGFGWVLKPQ